jgi:hypothetical protein
VAPNDLTGRRFTRWLVKSLDKTSTKPKFWYCVCDCGSKKRVNGYSLTSGASRSCGCLAAKETVSRFTTHGMHKHPAYQNWRGMHNRCKNPSEPSYKYHGARGIRVCERWASFDAFWEDMGATWKAGLTVERNDNDKDYEPDNCRWATAKEQANNRRYHRMIDTPYGPMNVSQASEAFGINRSSIMRRIRDGWPDDRLLEPAQFHPRWHTRQE